MADSVAATVMTSKPRARRASSVAVEGRSSARQPKRLGEPDDHAGHMAGRRIFQQGLDGRRPIQA